MTRLILALLFSVTSLYAAADSVSMGPGYANQVWYQPGVTKTSVAQSAWHIGFQSGISATIILNDALTGVKLYVMPNSTPASYDNVDTTGMSATWTRLYNKPATWTGAMNTTAEPSNIYDYGWGLYNASAHELQGSRVFVLVTPDSTAWKVFIQTWSGFKYTFKYARLDGSDAHTGEVIMNGIVEKEFIYWSFGTHSSIDHEPASDMWDVTFLKYTDLVSMGPGAPVPYPVVGILARPGVKLAKIKGADPSQLAPPTVSQFDTTANIIGWDWKTFSQATGQYTIEDSTAYFILRPDGSMWRMVMTGYGGNTTGSINFNTEVVIVSVDDEQPLNGNVVGVHPNVVTGGNSVTVVFDAARHIENAIIVDITGKTVRNIASNLGAGMYALPVSTTGLAVGRYSVVVQTASGTITSALIVH